MIHRSVRYLKTKAWKMFVLGVPPAHTPVLPATPWALKLCTVANKVLWGIRKPVLMFYYPLSQVSVWFLSFSTCKQMLLPIKHWLGWWCSCCSSRKMPLENTSPILPSQSFLWVSGLTRWSLVFLRCRRPASGWSGDLCLLWSCWCCVLWEGWNSTLLKSRFSVGYSSFSIRLEVIF